MTGNDPHSFDPSTITRPDPMLLRYYLLAATLSLFLFPFVFLPLYFKYETLRYRFDDKGISMSWGLLFRREVHLTYRRIQDIQLTRNIVQRWLGLASVAIQTASGASSAEMVIEGVLEAEALRDYLYRQMRGALPEKGDTVIATGGASDSPAVMPDAPDEALTLLHEIREALRSIPRAETRG